MKKKQTDINSKERYKDSVILRRIEGRDGITVPDGYFADFAAKMASRLPERAELEYPEKIVTVKTPWQRVRPYVYLAAMFAGIWCMLKMFTLMSGEATDTQRIDNNPVLAEAIKSESFVEEYVGDGLSQWDLYDDMMLEGIDPESLDSRDSDYVDFEEIEAPVDDAALSLPGDGVDPESDEGTHTGNSGILAGRN